MALVGLLLISGGIWLLVDEGSAQDVAQEILNSTNLVETIQSVPKLEGALGEVVTHAFFNYALIGMGVVTLLVALFGFCGAKKESTCLLATYSVCIIIVIILQLTAIVLINAKGDVIKEIKTHIKAEAEKIDIDVENLKAGDKFLQSLFFGVSAALSSLLLLLNIVMCCRVRREERVQGYVDSARA